MKKVRIRPVNVALEAAEDKLKRFVAMGKRCPESAKDWVRQEISYLQSHGTISPKIEFRAYAVWSTRGCKPDNSGVHDVCVRMSEEFGSPNSPSPKVCKNPSYCPRRTKVVFCDPETGEQEVAPPSGPWSPRKGEG